MKLFPFFSAALAASALAALPARAQSPGEDPNRYAFAFSATFEAAKDTASARIELDQRNRRVRELNFRMPAPTYAGVVADGELKNDGERWIWRPPPEGGSLRYKVKIPSLRGGKPDAEITEDWVIMRLEDLFPAARARAVKVAEGAGTLVLKGPPSWSFETAYGNVTGKTKSIMRDGRIYPQPRGWLVGGELGVRRARIADRSVVVAAPKGSGLRRMDMLTFLQWTLPPVTDVFPDFPQRLLIVGAPRSMWLGALSAPGSLYLHVNRPLVSENGTSTLVHELIHIAGVHSAAEGADWIVEGLAEYYALEILARSKGISQRRRERILETLGDWVESDEGELRDPSKGVHSARATLLFEALDEELRGAGSSIDAVARRLVAEGISEAALWTVTRETLGGDSDVLAGALEVSSVGGDAPAPGDPRALRDLANQP